MINEKDIITKYLGVPYLHLGRDIKGLDCWGLIICVYGDLGIKIFDLDNYEEHWAKKGKNYFAENYYQDWHQHGAPAFLDVILFKNAEGIANHAGVYLSYDRIIQATKRGVVVTRMDEKMKDNIAGIFRHIKIQDALK